MAVIIEEYRDYQVTLRSGPDGWLLKIMPPVMFGYGVPSSYGTLEEARAEAHKAIDMHLSIS